MKRAFPGAFAAALAVAALAAGCASAPPGPARNPAAELVYVANEASAMVSVVDAGNGTVAVVDLAALGYGDNAKPHHIAVEPDGSHWYVSLIGRDQVLKFDRDNRLVDSVRFEVPGLMVMSPDGTSLWVGRSMSAVNAPQRIGRVALETMEMEEFEIFVPMPHAVAVDPTGRWAFTGSMHENTLVRLDTETEQAELTRMDAGEHAGHGVAHGLVHYAISPDGRTLVATAEQTAKLLVFDISDPATMRLTHEVDVGARPWYPAFTPDGREVWFGNLGADEVTVVDAATWTVADVIRGEGIVQPHGIAIAPDGERVYLSNRNTSGDYVGRGRFGPDAGTLVTIDAATHAILDVVEIPHYGAGVGMAGSG